jgi:hypothetical protein
MRGRHWSTVVATALLITGCARPGDTPAGSPTEAVTVWASAAPAQRDGSVVGPSAFARRPVPPGVDCRDRLITTGPGATTGRPPASKPTASAEAARPAIPKPLTSAEAGRPPTPKRLASARAARPPAPKRLTSIGAASSAGAAADAAERRRRALAEANPPLPRRAGVPEAAAVRAESCARRISPELTLLSVTGAPDDNAIRQILSTAGLDQVVIRPGPTFAASTGKACLYGTLTSDHPKLSIGPLAPNGSCPP